MADLLGHTPARPSFNDPAVVRAACEAMLPEVMNWTEQAPTVALKAETLEDLVRHFDLDGYRFARGLDNYRSWASDSALVDILDSAYIHASRAHTALVKEWVIANDVTVPFSIGDRVSAPRHRGREVGNIEGIFSDTAQLLVRRASDAPGSGIVVAFEVAELVQSEVA